MKKTTKDELHLHPEMVKLTDRELAELALNEIGVRLMQRATMRDCLLANAVARLLRSLGGPFVCDDNVVYLSHETELGN